MNFSLLASYWWLLLLSAMVVGLLVFVLVAGRGAAGGFGGRARLGWTKWQALAKQAGEVQARVILTVFYFTAVAPFGLLRTHLGDPLQMSVPRQGRRWLVRRTRDLTLDDARRQF